MNWRVKKRVTIGGLLVLVAVTGVLLALLRPRGSPDEAEAIQLAKSYLAHQNEFHYPSGYWVRAQWIEGGSWLVGFMPPAGAGGYSQLVLVFPDRTSLPHPHDPQFFGVR